MLRRCLAALIVAGALLAGINEVAQAIRETRFGAALAALKPLLDQRPADPQLLTLRGMALAGLKRNRESLAAYEKALAAAPQYLPALLGKAEVEYRTGAQSAGATLERVLAVDPGNGTAHAMLGSLAFAANACKLALSHFEQGRAAVLRSAVGAAQFGDCLVRTGRPRQAVELIRDRAESQTLRVLASAYVADHNVPEAIQTLRRASELYPREESHYLDLGALCVEHKAFDLGIEVLGVGEKNIPGSSALRVLRGMIYAQTGDFASAEREFEEAGRLRPEKAFDVIGITFTTTLAGEEQLDRAIRLLRQRLKTKPRDAVLNYLLGEALLRRRVQPGDAEFEEARRALLRSVAANPDFAKARAALGRAYLKMDKLPEAIRELQAALRLDPKDQFATYQLARALNRSGRQKESSAWIQKLRQLKAEERRAEEENRKLRLVRAAPER